MPAFERGRSLGYDVLDRHEHGFGWIAHPFEAGRRASHAIRTDRAIWLIDPLWAPDVTSEIDTLDGSVAGVLVCSAYHARDADRFARHYDVDVWALAGARRIDRHLAAPVRTDAPSLEAIEVTHSRPFPGWSEAFLYWPDRGTMYVPEALGTVDAFTVGRERLGLHLARRLAPPRELLEWDASRVLVGHGPGIDDGVTAALEDALLAGPRRLPRAMAANGPTTLRSGVSALIG